VDLEVVLRSLSNAGPRGLAPSRGSGELEKALLKRLHVETRTRCPGMLGDSPTFWRCLVGYEYELSGDRLELVGPVVGPNDAVIADAAGPLANLDAALKRVVVKLDANFSQPDEVHAQLHTIPANAAEFDNLLLAERRRGSRGVASAQHCPHRTNLLGGGGADAKANGVGGVARTAKVRRRWA
jgi:hypothetical protein